MSCTFEFLWRFGSAWNSLVTRLSRSLALEAYAKVSPLIEVSTFSDGDAAVGEVTGLDEDCRTKKVKLNVSSSSLCNRKMKVGAEFWPASGS